jgi:hypothetical protein
MIKDSFGTGFGGFSSHVLSPVFFGTFIGGYKETEAQTKL